MFLAAASPKSKVLVLSKRNFWSSCCYNGAILWADFWYTRMLMSQGKKPYYFHFYTWNTGDPTQFRVHLTFSKWAEPDESIKLHFHRTSCLKIIVSDHTMVTVSKDVRLCLENGRHRKRRGVSGAGGWQKIWAPSFRSHRITRLGPALCKCEGKMKRLMSYKLKRKSFLETWRRLLLFITKS